MIVINEDKSFLSKVDFKAIENDVAKLGIRLLKFDSFVTEKEKQKNKKEYEMLSNEQWMIKCEQKLKEVHDKLKYIMDKLSERFIICQYNKKLNFHDDNWELFFWSNKGWNNKEYFDYITLSPNEKQPIEQQLAIINDVINILKTMDIEGVQVTIQYTAIYNEEKVQDIVLNYCRKMQNKMINYGNYAGKIIELNGRYFFKKKGTRKYIYEIDNFKILKNVFAK